MIGDEFLDRIKANPLFRQYVLRKPKENNTEPWHAIGQRLVAAAECALALQDKSIRTYGVKPEMREKFLLAATERIFHAIPFLWTDHTEKLADAAPLPKHIISSSVLAAPVMFWARETSYVAEARVKRDSEVRIALIETSWMMVLDDSPWGMWVLTDCNEIDPQKREVTVPGLSYWGIQYGSQWPPVKVPAPANDAVDSTEETLKRCAFLSSPFVTKEKTRLARHHRRQMERAGEPPEKVEEEVSVVKLRREVKPPAKPTGQHSEIEWQHQWWVSGHYRAQWYPQEEAHRVIWIAPYLKGPTDKPILEKVYAVVR